MPRLMWVCSTRVGNRTNYQHGDPPRIDSRLSVERRGCPAFARADLLTHAVIGKSAPSSSVEPGACASAPVMPWGCDEESDVDTDDMMPAGSESSSDSNSEERVQLTRNRLARSHVRHIGSETGEKRTVVSQAPKRSEPPRATSRRRSTAHPPYMLPKGARARCDQWTVAEYSPSRGQSPR